MPKPKQKSSTRPCEAFLKQSEEEMQPVGIIQVIAVIANDGRPVVVVEWPSGDMQMVERDEAVLLGLTMLSVAAQLFPSAEQFGEKIAHARGQIANLHPAGLQ